MRETTALGAAIAAGLAVGFWQSIEELEQVNTEGRTLFKPSTAAGDTEAKFARWEKAVEMCRGWAS